MNPQVAYTVLFYAIGAAAIVLAVAVTSARKLLRAAVCLMGVLLCGAGLYVMLGAEFLAGIQVLVYVGGVVVLIVFAVMLTQSADLLEDRPTLRRRLLAMLATAAFLGVTIPICWTLPLAHAPAAPAADGAAAIGAKLLDSGAGGYVLPFEIISLLLLAAMIGGIVVARKTPSPGQPFTSGGDRPGETDVRLPNSQRDLQEVGEER